MLSDTRTKNSRQVYPTNDDDAQSYLFITLSITWLYCSPQQRFRYSRRPGVIDARNFDEDAKNYRA
jgi:hypothetical protein